MHFESEFILNRQHFAECYEQSLPFSKNRTPRFKLIAILVVTALLFLLLSKARPFFAFFLLALALLEYISFHYREKWWLARQMWSRNAGNKIKLIIDDRGIKTESLCDNRQLLWSDIIKIEETEKGIIVTDKQGALNYLGKNHLNKSVREFIKQQKR